MTRDPLVILPFLAWMEWIHILLLSIDMDYPIGTDMG
jgi:hypothetical protein